MPRRRLVLTVALSLAVAGCAAPARVPGPPPPQGSVTLEVFDRSLAPYGQWVFLPAYGRVWHPGGIGTGWRPYFYGEWIWTDEGWFWDSDEPWGWATYHYGRWALDPTFGWVWVPRLDWAPAWVAWRVADGYVGWAPLVPGADPWWTEGYAVQPTFWVFVPSPRFVGTRVNVVAVPPAQVPRILPRARPAPPAPARPAPAPAARPAPPPRGGPARPDIEREIGRPVRPARIVPVPTPGDARARREPDTVRTYRPAPTAARPAPGPHEEKRRGE